MENKPLLERLADKYGAELFVKLRQPVFFINEIMYKPLNQSLTPYQEDWIRLAEKHKLLNILAFRSSGKTQSLLIDYPIFKAFTNKGFKTIIISDSLPQSTEVLKRIRERIFQSELLRTAVPSARASSWSKTEIELKNGSRIMCKPYSDRVRGYHVDLVGLDEAGEYKDMDIYTMAITPTVISKNGSIVLIGTPTSQVDLPHKLMKNKAYVSRVYPATMIYPNTNKTLWELRHPNMSLNDIKRGMDNRIAFTREYLCKPLSRGDELFPYEIIQKAFDYQDAFINKPRPGCKYFIGMDFALSGKAGADYSAYVVYEKNRDGVLKIVRIEHYKGLSSLAQKQRIKELNSIFRPVLMLGDEGTFGKALIEDLRAEHLPIKGFNFQGKRIELLETFRGAFDVNFKDDNPLPFNERKFLICKNRKSVITQTLTEKLVSELLSFAIVFKVPKGKGDMTGRVVYEAQKSHSDIVMASALGYFIARNVRKVSYVVKSSSGYSSLISKTG